MISWFGPTPSARRRRAALRAADLREALLGLGPSAAAHEPMTNECGAMASLDRGVVSQRMLARSRIGAWIRVMDGLRRVPVHDGGLGEAVGSCGLLGGTSGA